MRVIALSKLRLRPDSVVWDIGGGAGSVTIEAALLAPKGAVYVVERNDEDCENIRENIKKFGTGNVTLLQGNAPEGLDAWPNPDAVFVGGSGGRMGEIVAESCRRLQPEGRIVVDVATIENLSEAHEQVKAQGFETELTLVSVARSKKIVGLTRFDALNPVFIITGWRA